MARKVAKLLCFCHFCELHGPNVILTTHCVSQSDLMSYTETKHADNSRAGSSLTSSMSSLPTASLIGDNINLFSNEIQLISDNLRSRSHDCDGCSLKCKSMDGFNGFLSFNETRNLGFITNSYPIDGNGGNGSDGMSDSVIRDACIRSLSCEVYDSSEGEGLIYFGDDQRAHVLSYLFVLKDSKARGFQRTYSILVMSDDKHELLNDWDFYVKHIQQIVSKLKNRAKIIYESELTQTTCQQRRSLILDNVSNFHSNINSFDDFLLDRNPLNTHRTNSKARSLLELTGDNTSFAYLHIQFSWILFAVNSLNPTEQAIDSVKSVHTQPLAPSDQNLTLRNLYRFVGKERFQTIGYNIVIGNKTIIIDTNNSRLKCLMQCLSQLLPDECINISTDFHEFNESSKHNLIGISSLDLLPNNVMDSEFYALITIKDKTNGCKNNTKTIFTDEMQLTIHWKSKLPERLPNYLTNLENILIDMTYSDSTFNSYLMTSKNEWLNKALTFYSYTKGVNPPRSPSQMNAMFKLIRSEECDRKLVVFWANTGLNIEYKTKVFAVNSETELEFN